MLHVNSPSEPGVTPEGSPRFTLPSPDQQVLRHILLGDFGAIREAIHYLHVKGYAEAQYWSKPISTGRGGEYLSILTTRRII